MDLQSRFEEFLNPSKQMVLGFPIPQLTTPLAQRLVKRINSIQWYLHRYSLELNFAHQKLRVIQFLDFARGGGFDGVQIHPTALMLTASTDLPDAWPHPTLQ